MARSGAAQKRLQPWLATVATSLCLLSPAAQRPTSMLLLMPGQNIIYGMYAQLSIACIDICWANPWDWPAGIFRLHL